MVTNQLFLKIVCVYIEISERVNILLFRPPGFVVVVHHLAELCEAHNDREGDLSLQKALKFQLHHCLISLCGKIHFLLLKSPNYQNCHSDDQVAQ